MSIHARSIASAVVILLIGVWVGRATAPVPPPAAPSVCDHEGAEAAPAESQVPDPSADRAENLAVERALDAWGSDPRAGLVRSLAEWSGDPTETLKLVIDSMSDRELRTALTSLTNFNEEQLEGVRDMRRFTRRVAEVAVDSIYDGAPAGQQPIVEVQFSRAVDDQNAPRSAQGRFSADGRIYAVFPMDQYREDEVFVKWYRTDEPEILLFDQYPIQQSADYSYVWLDQENGWAEGEYAVEFYSADEELTQIAAGRYVVDR